MTESVLLDIWGSQSTEATILKGGRGEDLSPPMLIMGVGDGEYEWSSAFGNDSIGEISMKLSNRKGGEPCIGRVQIVEVQSTFFIIFEKRSPKHLR
jgi:hypothetical protein